MTITFVLGSGGTIGGESYILTVPSSLTTTSGWNAFDGGINVKANSESTNTFSGTLNVTAASSHDWALVLSPDKSDSVSYIIAAAEGATENTTTWTFTESEVNTSTEDSTKTAGVILGTTTGHTAGTYEDTITFTAEIATAQTLQVTIKDANGNNEDTVRSYTEGWTWQNMITAYPDLFSADGNDVLITVNGTAYPILDVDGNRVATSDAVSSDGGYCYES